MKYQHMLKIEFDCPNCEPLYTGVSEYRSNLVDLLEINEKHIYLRFERTKKYTIEECLYNAFVPTHYEVQRALTFYLAVTGKIPPVKSISLIIGDEESFLKDMSYTTNWKDCDISITYDKELAAKVFLKEYKADYVLMTYFIKAQLATFSIDKFHAAWSCMNAYYNRLGKKGEYRESSKLNKLDRVIRDTKMPKTVQMMKELETTSFWKKLQWYTYAGRNRGEEGKGLSIVEKDIYEVDRYNDRFLFMLLTKHIPNPLWTSEEQQDFVNKKSQRFKNNYNVRLAWLVCEYCYMLRNRGFHADKPFPLFSLSDVGNEKSIETILSEILLSTVMELLAA